MVQADWKMLQRDFEKERCVLLVGPKVSSTSSELGDISIIEELSLYIANRLDEYDVEYIKTEESKKKLSYTAQRFLSVERARRVDLEDEVELFYEQKDTTSIAENYEAIADLPVKLIVNMNQDDLLVKALLKKGKNPIVRYYNFKDPSDNALEPIDKRAISQQSPLVYYLIGSLQEKESLVITEMDQMEFIRNIVKGKPSIPDEVLEYFEDRNTFIFMGFDMQTWQFRLLMDTFKFTDVVKTSRPISPQLDNYPLDGITQSFYQEQFSFVFLEEKIDNFIKQAQNILRPAEDKEQQYLYIAFSESDKEHLEQLEKQLKPLEQNERLRIWHQHRQAIGEKRAPQKQMEKADAILLLLSSDFLADEQIMKQELAWAVDAYETRKCPVFLLLCRPCDWQVITVLNQFELLLKQGESVTDAAVESRDGLFFQIVQTLKKQLQL